MDVPQSSAPKSSQFNGRFTVNFSRLQALSGGAATLLTASERPAGGGTLKAAISSTRLKANVHQGIHLSWWSGVRHEPQFALLGPRYSHRERKEGSKPKLCSRNLPEVLVPSSLTIFIEVWLLPSTPGKSLTISLFSLHVGELGFPRQAQQVLLP